MHHARLRSATSRRVAHLAVISVVIAVIAALSASVLASSAEAAGNRALTGTIADSGAPTDVTAVAGDSSATVRWTDPTDVLGALVDGHEIDVLVDGRLLRTITGIGAQSDNSEVTGLTNGTAYSFRVTALSSAGSSEPSSESDPVTPLATPAVVSTTPANGAPRVRPTSNLTVVFNQVVQGISASTVVLTDLGTNAPVAMAMSVGPDGRTLSLDPASTLPAVTRFRLLLRGTLPGDEPGITAAGGRLPSSSIVFTTVTDAVMARVTGVVPASAVLRANRLANIRFDTSERVVGVTGATYRLQRVLAGGGLGAALPGVVIGNAAGTRWMLDPSARLLPRARYQVSLVLGAVGIRGATGHPVTGSNGSGTSYTWRFTTGR